jgi:tetratricopeptide (TPR) repeat protein
MLRPHRLWTPILIAMCCLAARALPLYAIDIVPPSITGPALDSLPLEDPTRRQIKTSITTHNYAGAEETLLGVVNEHPAQPQLYTFLGRLFFVDHKFLNAAIAMKKAEALQPLGEKDRFTLAMAYIAMGRPEWAHPEIETLAQVSPRNPLYPYWQGRLAYDRQDMVTATSQFQKAISLDADFMKAYDNLGLSLEGGGQFEQAIEQYRHAVQLNRERKLNSAWPTLDLGALLVKLDRLEEAKPLLKESLQYDPDFAQAHFELGILMEKNNEMPSAVEELSRATALDQSDPQPHYVLARVYRRAGNQEQAQRELQIFQSLKSKESTPRSE